MFAKGIKNSDGNTIASASNDGGRSPHGYRVIPEQPICEFGADSFTHIPRGMFIDFISPSFLEVARHHTGERVRSLHVISVSALGQYEDRHAFLCSDIPLRKMFQHEGREFFPNGILGIKDYWSREIVSGNPATNLNQRNLFAGVLPKRIQFHRFPRLPVGGKDDKTIDFLNHLPQETRLIASIVAQGRHHAISRGMRTSRIGLALSVLIVKKTNDALANTSAELKT